MNPDRQLRDHGFCSLPWFLTREEVVHFLNIAQDGEWMNHKSTVSGRASSLYFIRTSYKNYDRVALMKMNPNAIQDWHTDGTRSTVIIHPLTDNYASGMTRSGYYHGPVILDVTREHAVFNNEHTRICLQIGFDKKATEVWKTWNDARL